MSKIAVVSFGSGEISPELDARKDIEKYVGACRVLQNMIPDVYGNATRRPGTELITTGNGSGCYYEPPADDDTKIGISTMDELALIGNDAGFPMNGDYELRNNLDGTGINWVPIGIDAVLKSGVSFTGSFDGNFYTISNISIGTDIIGTGGVTDGAGLFLALSAATIENLIIANMTITGVANNTKNLSAGLLSSGATGNGTITNVHVQGSITAHRFVAVGGLCGQVNHDMNICSADVVLTANGNHISKVGGLAGFSAASSITNVYAQGAIDGSAVAGGMDDVGGLIGQMAAAAQTMENCYSAMIITGTISADVGGFLGDTTDATPDYTSCYWDDDIIPVLDLDDSGEDGDLAGITKSGTSVMQTQANYSGWDFDTIWQIDEGNDYPRFQWQAQADIQATCKRL